MDTFYALLVEEGYGYKPYIADDDEYGTMDVYHSLEAARGARKKIECGPEALYIAKVKIIKD